MYLITHLSPRTDIALGRHGFSIELSPDFREAVASSGIDQAFVNRRILSDGEDWLDACGFGRLYREETAIEDWLVPARADVPTTMGPGVKRVHPATEIRVRWGEWGPEHISVPGNACGLDIDRSPVGGVFEDGATLVPHNVDSADQKSLLLIVFTELTSLAAILARPKKRLVSALREGSFVEPQSDDNGAFAYLEQLPDDCPPVEIKRIAGTWCFWPPYRSEPGWQRLNGKVSVCRRPVRGGAGEIASVASQRAEGASESGRVDSEGQGADKSLVGGSGASPLPEYPRA